MTVRTCYILQLKSLTSVCDNFVALTHYRFKDGHVKRASNGDRYKMAFRDLEEYFPVAWQRMLLEAFVLFFSGMCFSEQS